jgi:thiamine pyrophosphate-dependent acetolactate synthase large subunit-like protein
MVIRFFKAIEDDPDMKLYTVSHEPGVGFAAVASARATRKPAVACVSARAEAGKHYSLLFKAGLGRASCIQKRTVEAFNGGTHEKRH